MACRAMEAAGKPQQVAALIATRTAAAQADIQSTSATLAEAQAQCRYRLAAALGLGAQQNAVPEMDSLLQGQIMGMSACPMTALLGSTYIMSCALILWCQAWQLMCLARPHHSFVWQSRLPGVLKACQTPCHTPAACHASCRKALRQLEGAPGDGAKP